MGLAGAQSLCCRELENPGGSKKTARATDEGE